MGRFPSSNCSLGSWQHSNVLLVGKYMRYSSDYWTSKHKPTHFKSLQVAILALILPTVTPKCRARTDYKGDERACNKTRTWKLKASYFTCCVTDLLGDRFHLCPSLSWLYSIYLKLFLFWAWCFAYRQANKGQTLNRRLFQWPADKHLCREIHPSSEGPLRQVALLAILNCLCWSWIESR